MDHYVFVHGIGDTDMPASLVKCLDWLKARKPITSSVVKWDSVLSHNEHELTRRTGLKGPVRQFMSSYVGDAITYSSNLQNRTYREIHRLVQVALDDANGQPVKIVAHSLGAVISCDHLWDEYGSFAAPVSLLTFGSPWGLYLKGYEDFGVPIRPTKWVNVWSREDPLSWPLQPLNDFYAAAVTKEFAVGGFNGLAHLSYWTNTRVLDELLSL